MPSDSGYTINVTVSNLTDPPTITCAPTDQIVVAQNSLILFQLQTEGYAFPTTGSIVVQDGGSEFPNLWYISPTQVALQDLCQITANYNYTVTVEETSSGKRHFHKDPTITNEPD